MADGGRGHAMQGGFATSGCDGLVISEDVYFFSCSYGHVVVTFVGVCIFNTKNPNVRKRHSALKCAADWVTILKISYRSCKVAGHRTSPYMLD